MVEIEEAIGKLRIVALKRGVEPIRIIPQANTQVYAADLIVAIGERTDLEALVKSE